MKEKKEKIKYKKYSFRLHDDTYKTLKKEKNKLGLSWNKYIYSLIKNKN